MIRFVVPAGPGAGPGGKWWAENRNGIVYLTAVDVSPDGMGGVSIGLCGQRQWVRGGLHISEQAMDAIAAKWVSERSRQGEKTGGNNAGTGVDSPK